MQKQLQKFGFFASKTLDEEASRVNDKLVKYLYKKETGASYKRKIKSANDTDTSPKHTLRRQPPDEDKHRRKNSPDSVRRHRRDAFASETEIFFISPEDIKKHRKKATKHREKSPEISTEARRHHKNHDYDPEAEKRRSLKRDIDIAKLISPQKHNKDNDYQWLTKKEIVKLIANNDAKELPKKTSTTSNFLKKFFLFEKHDESDFSKDKPRKVNRYAEDNTNMLFTPYKTGADGPKKNEKISKLHEKKHKEDPVDVVYTREAKKHRDKHKSEDGRKPKIKDNGSLVFEELKILQKAKERFHTTDSFESSTISSKPKRKHTSKECDLIFDDLKTQTNESGSQGSDKTKQKSRKDAHKSITPSVATESQVSSVVSSKKKHKINQDQETKIRKNVTETIPKLEKKKSKIRSRENSMSLRPKPRETSQSRGPSTDRGESSDTRKKIIPEKKENISRTNPLRHQTCLVGRTFPVVDISPWVVRENTFLEKKKKHKAFKRYYKYHKNLDRDCDLTSSGTNHAYSDSHKMYQGTSEHSIEDSSRNRRNKRSKFKVETHISAIVIDPQPQKTHKEADKKIRKSRKSKIPVLSNICRMAEMTREKSYTQGDEEVEVVEKTRLSRSPSRDHQVDNIAVERNKEKKTSENEYHDHSLRNKHRGDSRSSMMSKQSKKSGLKSRRTPSKSPLRTHRKPSSAKLLKSNASSTWSRSSKHSCKGSFSSKSDTKIRKRGKITTPKKKYNTLARTSASNSTCGDKSMESSKTGTFFGTKSFKDEEKLSRWQRSKLYSDSLRKSVINKKKSPAIPPQVMEVRYLSVSNQKFQSEMSVPGVAETKTEVISIEDVPDMRADFYDELPHPSFDDKIKEVLELPFDEILNENDNFLKKDFTLKLDKSTTDISSDDLSLPEKQITDWYSEFPKRETGSLSELSCPINNHQDVDLGSQDHIMDSLSAPGSEESGYATIKSRQLSRTFFQRPSIKALFEPPLETTFCVEVQIESKSSSGGLEIRSIETRRRRKRLKKTVSSRLSVKRKKKKRRKKS
ncbi:uncharacterized protein LOC103314191 isoform X2 [Tribolium castaneum]|uniref:uncharacterized protein LOC103314191 isoform X2 n=1 Tax=Tribolium castaneum TaxID=7070 RepID=UPI00046C26FD|nr:PREDICTED: uncharacterized protein LOC103314191 isoform X2 [Tribolium castaneum]|eukprot:XP_008197643.1 PREDICTED: uncharacterized protein LOC103314191 isoform X2 [Tribolium castaneum]